MITNQSFRYSLIKLINLYSNLKSVLYPLYRDMPLCLQITNIYLNHALGVYMQTNGINVIPNVRWGDERTYTPLFAKIPPKQLLLFG